MRQILLFTAVLVGSTCRHPTTVGDQSRLPSPGANHEKARAPSSPSLSDQMDAGREWCPDRETAPVVAVEIQRCSPSDRAPGIRSLLECLPCRGPRHGVKLDVAVTQSGTVCDFRMEGHGVEDGFGPCLKERAVGLGSAWVALEDGRRQLAGHAWIVVIKYGAERPRHWDLCLGPAGAVEWCRRSPVSGARVLLGQCGRRRPGPG